MALTKVGRGLLNTSIVDNGNATAITIDSSENVGIGTSTANRKLEISGNNNAGAKANYIRITDIDGSATAGNQQGGIEFYTNDNAPGIAASIEVLYAGTGGGGEFTFNTAAHSSAGVVEAMRIDASGNLLVGKTALNIGFAGQEFRAGSSSYFTTNGDTVLGLNRLSSDGTVLEIRKDSTIVGSIGTTGGAALSIESGNGVLYLNSSSYIQGATVGTLNSGTIAYFKNNSNVGVYLTAGNNSWTAASDERFKNITAPIENAAKKLLSLRTVIGTYKADESEKERLFLIAQDLQADFPQAVDSSKPNELGVTYQDMIVPVIAATNEHTATIAQMQESIDQLTARLEALEGA